MLSRTLTIADVCRVTGRSRYELRGLLDGALVEKASQGARVAREFTPHELLVIATMIDLEVRLGIKRSYVISISKQLSQVLSGPRLVNPEARLVITFLPPSVSYVSSAVPEEDAVVLSLGAIFERVDRYIAEGTVPASQAQFHFGPQSVTRPRTRVHRG